jgi:glycosyltransferase involved in cell wall biosynthesis
MQSEQTMKLSLCIPTMDRWDFLKINLHNYLENPYIDEIIISDENGNDCREIYNYFGNNPKIKLYSNSRCLGAYLNKEKSVSHAKNKWVALIDSDNYAPLSFFSTVYKAIDTNNPNIIYCPWRTIPQADHAGFDFRHFLGMRITYENVGNAIRMLWGNILINTGNYVFHKDMFLSHTIPFGLENHAAGIDVEARNYVLLKHGAELRVVKDMEYHHAVHNGSYWMKHENTDCKENDPIYMNLLHKQNPFVMTLRHWQTIKKPVSQWLVNTSEYDRGGHDGIVPFPIGMSYQIVNYKHLDMNEFLQHGSHDKLVLLSIWPTTDEKRRRTGKNRMSILHTLASKNYHTHFEEYDSYIRKLKNYKFVFSPEGNGIDCHRHYEALMAGTIPIAEENELIHAKYGNMPILYTEDYSEINDSYLEKKYTEMLDKVYDFTPLFLDFYDKETQTQIKACSNYWCNRQLKKQYGYS